ncbi:S9 family peptidase [Xylanibacillus composti]|nr:S9 family peptidase [Xylanibacillus composti]
MECRPLPDPSPDVEAEEWTYASDGLAVKGLLLRAKGRAEPHSPLMYCRGGIGRFGMVRAERLLPFVRLGYAVFAPYYRGYGSGGAGRDEFGGNDRHDVYRALALLPELEGIASPARGIPIVGFSRGAIMALLAARDCRAAGPVVVWGGVSDLLLTYEERVDLRRMLKRVVGHPVKQADAYMERSAVCWPERIARPVLLVHGSQDEQVSCKHAERLYAAMQRAGKRVDWFRLEEMGHILPDPVRDHTVMRIVRWIEEMQADCRADEPDG